MEQFVQVGTHESCQVRRRVALGYPPAHGILNIDTLLAGEILKLFDLKLRWFTAFQWERNRLYHSFGFVFVIRKVLFMVIFAHFVPQVVCLGLPLQLFYFFLSGEQLFLQSCEDRDFCFEFRVFGAQASKFFLAFFLTHE